MTTSTPTFIHRYEPGTSPGTLLLLHGTGGDENDLIDLGREIAPGYNLLSPRGRVSEAGMPRFFRRLAAGVFDEADLRAQTAALADFVAGAAGRYGFDPKRVTAVGFSNGANIAASLLLLRPEALSGAVLLRAMVPLRGVPAAGLAGKRVLISSGLADPYNAGDQATQLARVYREAGADVTVELRHAGHGLVQEDVDRAREWLAGANGVGSSDPTGRG